MANTVSRAYERGNMTLYQAGNLTVIFPVALEKLESIYKSCVVVNNLCVYGDSFRPKPVAVILPLEPRLREIAKELEIEGDFEELCASEVLRQEVLRLLLQQAKVGGLKGSELLHDIHVSTATFLFSLETPFTLFYSHVFVLKLSHDEWTPENGFLTAAQKLKRNDINKQYKTQLDAM
jgi:long-chain acyl-CoA synthetase